MNTKVIHPGFNLDKLLNDKGMSQRELASQIDIAHSLLNGILKGNRNININIAIALEAAGFKTANYWLVQQVKFNLELAKKDNDIIKKNEAIKTWNKIEKIIPLSYFKKQDIGINSSDNIEKIYEIYNVKSYEALNNKVNTFNPTYFRKSSKFSENKNNVLAWSLFAEYKLKDISVNKFSRKNETSLIDNLNYCFYEKKNVIQNSKNILEDHGIKFLILDRPSQTPVDGKSFLSGKNPAIAMSLKYKRLDNFAFTLFHELGHVFEHLTNPQKPEYKNEDFFTYKSKRTELVEFEADRYAAQNLIDESLFDDFIASYEEYTDDVILSFSKKNKIHPGIVRGRVCHTYNEYYRKRSIITSMNKLQVN